MDKIKKVFSPGAPKDDEIMYGDQQTRGESVAAGKQPDQNTDTLHPAEGLEKKEKGGVFRQEFNPDNAKHDELRHGTTATTQEPERPDPNKLQTDENQKDRTMVGQILNPGGKKYDEQRHDSTAATEGARGDTVPIVESPGPDPNTKLETDSDKKNDRSILKQIFNPGRKKHDEAAHSGKTAHEAGESSNNNQTPAKDDSVTRQVLNPGGEKYDTAIHETSQTDNGAAESSNVGRDAAIAGGAAAVGGGAAYAATRDKDESSQPLQDKSTTRFSDDRAEPGANSRAPADARKSEASATLGQVTDDSNLGRDTAAVGAGTAAISAGAHATHQHSKGDEDNKASSTLDAKPQTDGLEDGRSSTEAAEQSSGSHNYGRDAAIAGGAGALGAGGAYAATRGRAGELEKGDTVLAATGTGPVQKPFDEEEGGLQSSYNIPDRSASSNLPGEASNLEPGPANIDPVGGSGPTSTGYTEQLGASHHPTTGSHINPIGAPDEPAPTDSSYVRKAAVAGGAGAVGAGGIHTATQGNDRGSAPDQINPAHIRDVEAATYTYSSQPIGGTSEDSSRPFVAPHVPGEYPTETGQDPHETSKTFGSTAGGSQVAPLDGEGGWGRSVASRAIGSDDTHGTVPQHTGNDTSDVKPEGHGKSAAAGVAGVGLASAGAATTYGALKSSEPTSTAASSHHGDEGYPVQTSTTTQQSAPAGKRHEGRDAAVTGGALGLGAAGAGTAFEATRGQHDDASVSRPRDTESGNEAYTSSQPLTTSQTTTQLDSQPATQETTLRKDETHYGRDGAIAGGIGAAGAGAAYAATRDRDQPTTQTGTQVITPQQTIQTPSVTSKVVEDPTTTQTSTKQPTTQDTTHRDQTKSATKTSEQHKSDLANKADPRVESDPAKQAAQKAFKDHDYETRDAVLASGAVGAGAGAASYDTTHEAYGAEDPNKHNKLHKPSPDEKKAEKEAEKEQKKADKEAEREHKKAEKEAEKEHKKAEKQAEKEQKKAEKEAEKEDKPSLLDRILHSGRHSEDKEGRKSVEESSRGRDTEPATGFAATPQQQPSGSAPIEAGDGSGRVIEPHTGLPMNVEKFGTGAGGTDGSKQIEGYHEQDAAVKTASVGTGQGAGTSAGHAQPGGAGVAGPDWDAIRKNNTPH